MNRKTDTAVVSPLERGRRRLRGWGGWRQARGTFCLLALLVAEGPSLAQSYALRYTTTASGAVTFTGNTLGLAKQSNQNRPGQMDSIGAFITLNTNSRVATYPAGTTLNWSNNASRAVLRLPADSTVLYAELIWAGAARIANNTTPTGDVRAHLDTPVHFTLPDGSSYDLPPDPVTASIVTNGPVNNPDALFYVRSTDVTALVQGAGPGAYGVGGVPGCVLASENANNACGWTLAVLYGNPSLPQRNLSLFIGNSFAATTAPTPDPVGVVGFCAPPSGVVHGYLFVSAVEGDPNKTGDQMLFGPTTNSLARLSGPNNPATNFFGGQINLCQPDSPNSGLLDTSGTFGLSNSVPPTVAFSARQGWDITCVDVSAGLANGIQSAYAQNVTQGDGYSVNALALQIDVGAPVLNATQTVDKSSTFVGDMLTYSVLVTNSGAADALNVTFNDPLPFGTSFVPGTLATNGVFLAGADPVSGLSVPVIPSGSSVTFTYRVQVNQIPPSAKFTSSATLTYQYAGACERSPVINSLLASRNIEVFAALLEVDKTASVTNLVPGATFTYTISISNLGTTNSVDSTLIDPLPVGVTYVPNTTTLNGAPVPDLAGVNMPYTVAREIHGPGSPDGQIDAGDTAIVSFQVTISDNPPTRISNIASVLADGGAPSSTTTGANNISPVFADLAVGLVGSPGPVAAGAPISLTLSVTNQGPDAVDTVTNLISVFLPLSPSILSPTFSPSEGTYDPLTGIWSGIALPPDGVLTLNISGQVAPTTPPGNLVSTVTVKPPPGITETQTNNNSALFVNAIMQVADLAVAILDGGTAAYAGGTLTDVVTVSNLGPSFISSLVITNGLDPALLNPVVLPDEGVLNPFNGTWNALALAPGGSVALTIHATVSSNAFGSITNWTTVSVPPGVNDPVPTNNVAADVQAVFALPDTVVVKTGPTNVVGGALFSYTLTVSNSGLGTSSNVVASDALPPEVSFVSASGGGTVTDGIATWTLGTVGPGTTTNLTLTVTAPWAAAVLTNVATLTASTPTLHPGNNLSLPVVTIVSPGASDAGRLAITSLDAAGAHLLWYGPAGGTYAIESETNLLVPNWQVITNFASTNTVMNLLDAGATNDPSRFYRARTGG